MAAVLGNHDSVRMVPAMEDMGIRVLFATPAIVFATVFVSLPLIVYIMMGFFDGLPEELEEAALVDGLTHIGAFRRVTLPLSVVYKMILSSCFISDHPHACVRSQ